MSWQAPVLHCWADPGRPRRRPYYYGHIWRGQGAGRCDVCGRTVVRGQGRWWER